LLRLKADQDKSNQPTNNQRHHEYFSIGIGFLAVKGGRMKIVEKYVPKNKSKKWPSYQKHELEIKKFR